MINPFSEEVQNAGNGESGIYTPPCCFLEECGSQMDASSAVKRGLDRGLTREELLEQFNRLQAKNFQQRLRSGQVGIKRTRGNDLDLISEEDLLYREDLW